MSDAINNSDVAHSMDPGPWIVNNVLHPLINESVIQPINAVGNVVNAVARTVTQTDVIGKAQLLAVPEAEFGSKEWAAQSISSGLGAIVPYVVAGQIARSGLRAAGVKARATGTLARFLSGEQTAMIAGAAAYDGLRDPHEGETRIGNALGGAASFFVLGKANRLTHSLHMLPRIGVMAGGGAVSGITHNTVSSLISRQEIPRLEELSQSALSGSFMNLALPFTSHTIGRGITHANLAFRRPVFVTDYLNARYAGAPADRVTRLKNLVLGNPLTRVREGAENSTNHENGTVTVTRNANDKLVAEELAHVKVRAGDWEPQYRAIAEMLSQPDESQARNKYIELRLKQEQRARQLADDAVEGNGKSANPISLDELRVAPAQVGKTYEQMFVDEFEHFKNTGGKFRPTKDFHGEEPPNARAFHDAAQPENWRSIGEFEKQDYLKMLDHCPNPQDAIQIWNMAVDTHIYGIRRLLPHAINAFEKLPADMRMPALEKLLKIYNDEMKVLVKHDLSELVRVMPAEQRAEALKMLTERFNKVPDEMKVYRPKTRDMRGLGKLFAELGTRRAGDQLAHAIWYLPFEHRLELTYERAREGKAIFPFQKEEQIPALENVLGWEDGEARRATLRRFKTKGQREHQSLDQVFTLQQMLLDNLAARPEDLAASRHHFYASQHSRQAIVRGLHGTEQYRQMELISSRILESAPEKRFDVLSQFLDVHKPEMPFAFSAIDVVQLLKSIPARERLAAWERMIEAERAKPNSDARKFKDELVSQSLIDAIDSLGEADRANAIRFVVESLPRNVADFAVPGPDGTLASSVRWGELLNAVKDMEFRSRLYVIDGLQEGLRWREQTAAPVTPQVVTDDQLNTVSPESVRAAALAFREMPNKPGSAFSRESLLQTLQNVEKRMHELGELGEEPSILRDSVYAELGKAIASAAENPYRTQTRDAVDATFLAIFLSELKQSKPDIFNQVYDPIRRHVAEQRTNATWSKEFIKRLELQAERDKIEMDIPKYDEMKTLDDAPYESTQGSPTRADEGAGAIDRAMERAIRSQPEAPRAGTIVKINENEWRLSRVPRDQKEAEKRVGDLLSQGLRKPDTGRLKASNGREGVANSVGQIFRWNGTGWEVLERVT